MYRPKENGMARINIRGMVQGVGFRPFVYKLAIRNRLKGWVCNTSGDVTIEVEGLKEAIGCFLEQLKTQAPPRAQIEDINSQYLEPFGYETFEIKDSLSLEGRYQLISPDIATCPLCQKELFNPRDRRYHFPFINCTNCGPRFTIIKDIPYDRPKTTMRHFRMCPECRAEYDDPLDRRFHAQPNCCPECGPKFELANRSGNTIASQDPIADTATLLNKGKIIALKGIGGFLLACDATNENAVHLLRQRKKRPSKPFALMMATFDEIKTHCFVSKEEEMVLTSPESPIVLLRLINRGPISSEVSPHLNYLGVMLPYTPIHHLLMREVGVPLVMTSGNLSEEPIIKDNNEALRKLGNIADYFLFHNRDIYASCDDSVTMIEYSKLQVIRRARGYAPHPIHLPFKAREVLACGADLKNTFCITKDQYAFMSQHIGDMDNLETLTHFENMLEVYKKLFRLNPKIAAHDKHPDYFSTKYAQGLKARDNEFKLVPVQHHHAHIVSCMAENGVKPPVLGVAFDGTGYGDDGAMWGGEFLLTDYSKITRLGHLEYVPMPGGDAAVKRPYRMAISYLLTLIGEEAFNEKLVFLEDIKDFEIDLIKSQIKKRINSPMTSSAGRLFDAVAALIGIRNETDYEGQAAIELEMIAKDIDSPPKIYPFDIVVKNGEKVIRLRELLSNIIIDLSRGISRREISAKFHSTMACIISRMCKILARSTGIDQVALSGGVFQNRLLLRLTRAYVEQEGLKVITHREVPCNDGGVSLGQAVIANFITQ